MAHGKTLLMRHAGRRTRPLEDAPKKARDRSLNGKARVRARKRSNAHAG
ncbi:hypothetical protein GCM10009737_07880 [Nocardioides lentus]|uniref:Uncharacterized protein n=1 Tax=Nocardioides lentus TaxID=338077 RepID=A0ABN2P2U9_9ACTN